jgi:hypothetical protein
MSKNHKLRFALEELGVGLPAAGLPGEALVISVPEELDRLQAAEEAGNSQVNQLVTLQESAIALESLQRSLKRPDALAMGKMGARYFNVAAESFLEQARLSPDALPMDVRHYEQAPLEAVNEAADSLTKSLDQLMTMGRGDLVSLMASLVEKRASMVRILQDMHHRLDEIDEDLTAVDEGKAQSANPDALQVVVGTHNKYRLMAYSGLGVVAKGATVSGDVIHLLDEHMAMYKRLVHNQGEWVRQHRDNLMVEVDKFSEQYSFDPSEYLMAGAQYTGECVRGLTYQSKALPGGLRYFCITAAHRSYGFNAIELLMKSTSYLAPDPQYSPKNTPTVEEIRALSVMEIRARVKEMRMALLKLREWCDFVHRDLWAQAMFEDAIVGFMVVNGTGGERTPVWTDLSRCAAVVVKLLNEASSSMGTQLLGVFQGLLCLLEDSIRVHVPQHIHEVAP